MLTDNWVIVEAAKKNYENFYVPTKLVDSVKHERNYLPEDKSDLDVKTSVNKIGEIINCSQIYNSILWDKLNNGATVDDVMDLYCDIATLDVMSNLEIEKRFRRTVMCVKINVLNCWNIVKLCKLKRKFPPELNVIVVKTEKIAEMFIWLNPK